MKATDARHIEVSVIVPVYNAGKYIDRCISSLVNQQTTWDFELLLIDDGSKDNSLDLLKELEQRDCRIHVISQANKGPSAARNYGLREALGNYVVFIDSDDWVEPHYIDGLRNAVGTDDYGLIIEGYLCEKPEGIIDNVEKPQTYHPWEYHLMIKDRELYRKGYVCGKLYNLSLIKNHNLAFDEDVFYSEDLIFLFSYLCYAKYVRFIDDCGYHYDMTHPNTQIQRYHAYENELKGYRSLKRAVANLKIKYQISDEQLKPTTDWVVYFAMRTIKTMYRPGVHHLNYNVRQMHLLNDWEDSNLELLNSKSDSFHGIDKIIYICLRDKRTVILDLFLTLFFFCRYSFIGKLYMKYICK